MSKDKRKFTAITIARPVYDKLKETKDEINEKAGYRKFRSVAHLVEEAVVNYYKDYWKDKEGGSEK